MNRWRLTIAYDGRPYSGWQSQARGVTIQDTLETAVAQICGAAVRVHGSGRTDKGVHALAQVAHFDAPEGCRISEPEWHRALNALLPPTLLVMRCARAADDFHARYDASGKIYRYRLFLGEVLPPLEAGLAWQLWGCIDEPALRKAARLFVGTQDFSAFCANRGNEGEAEENKVRTIKRLEVEEDGPFRTLVCEGDGFLYKMVRMITGSLVQVGRGKAKLEDLEELLANPAGRKAGLVAPADGLMLVRVIYEK